jgi:hypothetical protein
MNCRLAVPFAFALALSIPGAALADVDGGTTSDAGTTDPTCTIDTQSSNGTTCKVCAISGSDTGCQTELGNDYNYVCTHDPSTEVWCNGPDRTQNLSPSCALGSTPATGGAAFGAVIALAALSGWGRKRRRS